MSKSELIELINKIPFGKAQREELERAIDQMDDVKAQKLLESFRKARDSANRALKSVTEYRLAQERRAQRAKTQSILAFIFGLIVLWLAFYSMLMTGR